MTKDEFTKILDGLQDVFTSEIEDDKEFDTESQKQLLERDKQYSELLMHFVDITKTRNKSKENNKWIYFRIVMGLMISLSAIIVCTIIVILIKCNASQIVESIPVLITAIAGFASVIIAIPVSITQYLFSTKEDKYITSIISHTQEHDLSSRKILKAIEDATKQNSKSA